MPRIVRKILSGILIIIILLQSRTESFTTRHSSNIYNIIIPSKVLLGGRCSSNLDCISNYSFCDAGICKCQPGFSQDWSRNLCKQIFCHEDSQCNFEDKNRVCKFKICYCRDGYYQDVDSKRCFLDLSFTSTEKTKVTPPILPRYFAKEIKYLQIVLFSVLSFTVTLLLVWSIFLCWWRDKCKMTRRGIECNCDCSLPKCPRYSCPTWLRCSCCPSCPKWKGNWNGNWSLWPSWCGKCSCPKWKFLRLKCPKCKNCSSCCPKCKFQFGCRWRNSDAEIYQPRINRTTSQGVAYISREAEV